MNIALGAVLIFILLIPPIAFYISYNSVRDARGGAKLTFLDGLLLSAIVSLFVHGIAIYCFVNREIRFDILLRLIAGDVKEMEKAVSNHEFKLILWEFAKYNFWIFIVMISLGLLFKWLSRLLNLHTRYAFLFRLHNRWWYIFNGYIRTDWGYEEVEFDYLFLDAVVKVDGGTVIYTGILVDSVSEGEVLDRIYIRSVLRRDFKSGVTQEPTAGELTPSLTADSKEIPGDLLCIQYSQIMNLNIRYISLPKELTAESLENANLSADNDEPAS